MRIAKNVLRVSKRLGRQALIQKGHQLDGVDGLDLDQRLAAQVVKGEVYLVDGERLTRPQVVEYVCRKLCDGRGAIDEALDLVDLCSERGMPKLSVFRGWLRNNRLWEEAVNEAEKTRAMLLVHEARGLARSAAGAPQAGGSKLAVEALQWEAAKINNRFADKQILEVESGFQGLTDEALVSQLVAALKADPAAMKLLAPQLKDLAPELSSLALAARDEGVIEGEKVG